MNEVSGVQIGLCGLGSIGRQVAKLLLDHRRGIEIVAAITLDDRDQGKPLAEVAGAGSGSGPIVGGSLDELLDRSPEVVIVATGSFMADTLDTVLACVESGAHVISPCEELAFPFGRFAEEAERLDQAARRKGVTVLGSGVNPGFIFDSLLLNATGVCWDVEKIHGRRVVDVTGFGENIHLRLGIGYTLDEFERGHAEKQIAGHVGFPESIEMVCERLGVTLDGPVAESFEPLIAETAAPTRYGEVPAGKTEGFVQRAVGTVDGRPFVELELILHLRPTADGYVPADTIEISGTHPVSLTLDPGMDAVLATSAELVNGLPGLLAAPPGLLSVKDLPPASAWLGAPSAAMFRPRR